MIVAQVPFEVDQWGSIATLSYDPLVLVDAINVDFGHGNEWTVYIEFFRNTHNWGGDIKSVVTSDNVYIVLYTDKHAVTVFSRADIDEFLTACAIAVEAQAIVIPWQREREIEQMLQSL